MSIASRSALPPTFRGQVEVHRQLLPGPDGLVALRQRFAGSDLRVIVTQGASVLALVQVEAGQVSFPLHGLSEVPAPRRFVLAVPPRSTLPIRFDQAVVTTDGVGSFSPLSELHNASPRLLAAGCAALSLERPTRATLTALAAAPLLAELDMDAGVRPELVRARQLLHESLGLLAPVRRVARELGMASETLTRQFAAAYFIAPKQYCHRARLFDAALQLLAGQRIVEAALESGFNDLSRFYSQFRRMLGATPGAYAAVRKRQDRGMQRDL